MGKAGRAQSQPLPAPCRFKNIAAPTLSTSRSILTKGPSMTRNASFEAASEHLRMALPLMSKYQIPVVPLNYAVWYEYVAGGSRALEDTLDRLIGANEAIDETATRQL